MDSGINPTASGEVNTTSCDPDVHKYGVFVGFAENSTVEETNLYCQARTEATGRKHDWHNYAGRKRILALPEGWEPPPEDIKGHEIAHIVNELRDIGKQYGQTQQLREHFSWYMGGMLKQLKKPRSLKLDQLPSSRVEFKPSASKSESIPLDPATKLQVAAVLFNTVIQGGTITPEQQKQLIEFITGK